MEENKLFNSSDVHVVGEVPPEERQSWVAVMFVWMGTMIAVPSILLGSDLAAGLTFGMALFAGVMIADYWILHRGKNEWFMEQDSSKWVGITAWILGTIAGLIIVNPDWAPAFITNNNILMAVFSVGGLFISLVLFIIFKKMDKPKKITQ